MATSIASQLQSIKSVIKADDSAPLKRPFTRPTILFDPKEAADIDIDTIFSMALSGLEVLANMDARFKNYKNNLFSFKSRELDREMMGAEKNKQIDASISSYLRLLSAYLESTSAVKTLEYLIRRYKIHVHNAEDLILCSLPFHDTHIFVRIVQLIDPGNSKWRFIDGVRSSGAPLPRSVIVQQLIRDTSLLDALCNYASPYKTSHKKVQPSRPMVSFCTAAIIEGLGSLTVIDSNVVEIVIRYVHDVLQSSGKGGLDHKAGSLMIVCLLASKATLSSNLVKHWIGLIANIVREDAKESSNVQSFHMSFMALINLVQLQSIEMFTIKVVDALKEIRDISSVLCELTKDFNIDRFLVVLVDSFLEHSLSDDLCRNSLISVIEGVPVKDLVNRIVVKLLNKLYRLKNDVSSAENGSHAKEILCSISNNYPSELRLNIQNFLKENQVESKSEGSIYEILCRMLDGNLDFPLGITDSGIWFALEHPKPEVRCSTLSRLDVDGILKDNAADSQRLTTIKDAILRRLYDDDLSVVQAALNINRLPEVLSSSCLLDALPIVIQRCFGILNANVSDKASVASDVVLLCLDLIIENFLARTEKAEHLARLTFPFILILPKTWRVNHKALKVAKEMKWPLFQNIVTVSIPVKKLDHDAMLSINMDNIRCLAETFSSNHEEYVKWLVECFKDSELSKTIFFLILLQSLTMPKIDAGHFLSLYESCFPVLKVEWKSLHSEGINFSADKFNPGIWNWDCKSFVDCVPSSNNKELNVGILISLFWKLVDTFTRIAPEDVSLDKEGKWSCMLEDLFLFFSSQPLPVFKKHLHYLVTNCKTCPVRFLSELFTEEGVSVATQVQCLHSFAFLCSQAVDNLHMQLLSKFPTVLVPLSGDMQEARIAAMSCIEEMNMLTIHVNSSGLANGNGAVWSQFLGELLALMVQNKKLILSDKNVLSAFFTSLLRASSDSLLVPQTVGQRFDQSTKDKILHFLVGSCVELSAYAKLRILSLLQDVGSKVFLVEGVESLLNELLKRRHGFHLEYDKSCCKLTKTEVETLCLLLQICTKDTSSLDVHFFEDHMLRAVQLDGRIHEDAAILQPCITILSSLNDSFYRRLKTGTQDRLFRDLVFLFRCDNAAVQNCARECLLRLDINPSIVMKMLELVLEQDVHIIGSPVVKKKKGSNKLSDPVLSHDFKKKVEYGLPFLSSLIDILLLKKNIVNRETLMEPLFKILHNIFLDDVWLQKASEIHDNYIQASSGDPQTFASTIIYIQQALLVVLEDICASHIVGQLKENLLYSVDLDLLNKCARSAKNATTRNHIFTLLATIAKIMPDNVLDHILDILTIAGESAVTQWDGYSQRVFENLITVVVPCWLSKTKNTEKLLHIFVDVLPEVPDYRRLSIIVHLLRTIGEKGSFGSLLALLFRSLVSRSFSGHDRIEKSLDSLSSIVNKQWEFMLAMQLSEQYSCMIWLPSLVMLLRSLKTNMDGKDTFLVLAVSVLFVSTRLQDPEIAFKIESGEDSGRIQKTAGTLMEHVVFHLQYLDLMKRQTRVPSVIMKELKECMHTVLRTISKLLPPSIYFSGIVKLLGNADTNINRKALALLREAVKDMSTMNVKDVGLKLSWLHLNEDALEAFKLMCLDILKFVDACDDDSSASLKVAAVSTLEVLVNWLASNESIFSTCLKSIVKSISSANIAVSSICLRATGALVNVIGPKALSELPSIMEHILRSHNVVSTISTKPKNNDRDALTTSLNSKESFFMSVLVALEAVVDKLGGFLNPYLLNILKVVVFGKEYISGSDMKLKLKADVVRKLIAEKIPVRLLFPPVMEIYSEAVISGDSSLLVVFQMLRTIVVMMDRSAVSAYHAKIFDLCLQALDLRRQRPISVVDIDVIEGRVVDALISLTMKLTETMFRPLFFRSMEWLDSDLGETEFSRRSSINRAISFYGLVNKLAESHRSLFLPYFKYLLKGCARHLSDKGTLRSGLTQKKKARLEVANGDKYGEDCALSIGIWHLRALVLSSLHKCFLYDIGSLKILDSSDFEVLLKPIVSQLLADPPASLERHSHVPSLNEVNDTLVSCVAQMAVTAGTDLLWKPMNHEVLMQTRSEKVRARILGLKIVKLLMDKLKEEYLVLLPETIPILAELLEDVELPVKSLAQEVFKEMEALSGENLQQYL